MELYIQPLRVQQTLQRLISFPTVNPLSRHTPIEQATFREALVGCREYLVKELEAMRFAVNRFSTPSVLSGEVGTSDWRKFIERRGLISGFESPHLHAYSGSLQARKQIFLTGHFDVVDVDKPKWGGINPFSETFIDGKIYGRGALDMKGGVATFLEVARVLSAQRLVDENSDVAVHLLLVSLEEMGAGKFTGAHYLDQMLYSMQINRNAKFLIIEGEPNLGIVTRRRGAATLHINLKNVSQSAGNGEKLFVIGKSGHVGNFDITSSECEHPLFKLAREYFESDKYKGKHIAALSWPAKEVNVVVDEASLEFSDRATSYSAQLEKLLNFFYLLQKSDLNEFRDRDRGFSANPIINFENGKMQVNLRFMGDSMGVKKKIQDIVREAGLEMTDFEELNPMFNHEESELSFGLERVASGVELASNFIVANGCSDLQWIARLREKYGINLQAAGFGPFIGGGEHGNPEWVELNSLVQTGDALLKFIFSQLQST